MTPITGVPRRFAWGSTRVIPDLLGEPASTEPLAELWFGAHPRGSSQLPDGRTLQAAIAASPESMLGDDVRLTFGDQLPFLVKLLAPARPLSLQVHPTKERAEAGFAAEERAGMAPDDPVRSYPDRNHKPEMLFALTTFEALSGFRAPRRAIEMLDDLTTPLARALRRSLADRDAAAMHRTFARLIGSDRPDAAEIAATVAEVSKRLDRGESPSPRIDRIVSQLGEWHPGDPGALAVLLLNPVTLQPGEALFVAAGNVHCYLTGLGLEVLANSDNVVRAGLTSKHVDTANLLEIVDCAAAPPVRIGAERVSGAVDVFYAPVDDFELAIATTLPAAQVQLPGRGPRIVLGLDGEVTARTDREPVHIAPGRAVFVPAGEPRVRIEGRGRVAQAGVP